MRRIQLQQFMGRFGNQLIQYAVARALAEKFGAQLETPDWCGRRIFAGVNNPIIARRLPGLPAEALPDRPDVSCHGFWQFQRAFDLLSRSKMRSWLRVREEWLLRCRKPRPFYIACHVRAGDYRQHPTKFAVVERESFEKAVLHYGYDLKDVIWLTEETPHPGSDRFPREFQFLNDFLIIQQADVIFRSNSTFSQLAAILSNTDKLYSPMVGDLLGSQYEVPFIEGNHAANLSMKYHNVEHTDMRLRD